MKTLLIVLAVLLAGCSSTGRMISDPDPSKPRSVFVEPFKDYPTYTELHDYAATGLGRAGYDAVKDEKAASYRLRSQLNWSLTNINLSLRLVDSKSGQMIYFGECRNYGWGTMIAASGSMSDCFDQAFSELR